MLLLKVSAYSTRRIYLIDTIELTLLDIAEFIDLEAKKIVSFKLLAILPDIGVESSNLLHCNRTNSRILELLMLKV